jgi:hypothetical protein
MVMRRAILSSPDFAGRSYVDSRHIGHANVMQINELPALPACEKQDANNNEGEQQTGRNDGRLT